MKNNASTAAGQTAAKKEIFGHAVAGFGQNLIYGFWSGYTMVFFTDVFGIAASAAGLIVLFSRIWDAINDPMMGAIADRTRTRWGRYRPWFLFMALPITIFLTLNFSTPNLSGGAKVAYAAVTYILMSMAFTGVDVPYWTLPSAMSSDPNQRGSIFATSRLSTTLSALLVSIVAVPIITALSGNGTAAGYRNAALLFGCVGAAFYLVGFLFIAFCLAGSALYFLYFLYGYKNLTGVLVFTAIAPIPLGCLSILASTMISSTIEYMEWKTGQRNEGIISSSQTFSSKVCLAIGGGLSGLILTLSNYVPNQQQTVATLNVFHGTLTLAPTILFLIAIVPMLFFDLTNERYAQIVEDLKQRRVSQAE